MNEYTRGIIFALLGLFGGALHYVKQRYVTKSTQLSFLQYLQTNIGYTLQAFAAIIVAEFQLASASEGIIHLAEITGAISTGYMANSALNKAEG